MNLHKKLTYLLLILALLVVKPVSAQDATAEPTAESTPVVITAPVEIPDDSTVVVVEAPQPAPADTANPDVTNLLISVVSIVVLFVLAFFGRSAIAAAKDSLPPWAFEPLLSALDSVLSTVERTAAATSDPSDDANVAQLRREYEALKLELRNKTEPGK
jgi:hypothetical protein